MSHQCPVPNCSVTVPSSQFACRAHWFRLPAGLRREIWRTYRLEPLGDEHLEAMAAARLWLRENV